MKFEWDNNKEANNIKKHGISFIVAAQLFFKPHYEKRSDQNNEERYLAVGELEGRVLAVVYTRREEKYRIISARRANKHEEAAYKKNRQI